MIKSSRLKKSLKNMDSELSKAEYQNNFQQWLFSQIYPYLTGNILELGSGLGAVSNLLVSKFGNNKIYLSDRDNEYVKKLKYNFKKFDNVKVAKIDIEKKSDFKNLYGKIDSIFAVNVLEHVKNDLLAFRNIYRCLKNKGRFVILVPAHPLLYNNIDKAVGHYRRYTKKSLKNISIESGFKIKTIFYFNAVSIIGWFLSGQILKQSYIKENNLSLLNKFIPLIASIEKILAGKIGISLIAILEK